MSREISEITIQPLSYSFDSLYNKYILLSSIDYKNFGVEGEFDKSLCCAAFELFRLLSDDFEKVFYEIKKLEKHISDDNK